MFQGGYTLIDADSIYFRTCCVTKNKKDIRKNIDHAMTQIRRECMTDDMFVAVKGHGNFRKDLYPKYKANRPALAPDLKEALEYGHEYIIHKHNAVMANGMEADDLVSIWAYECMSNDTDYTIVGIDKDLLQIPGNHYNFVKQTHTTVDVDTADYNLMLQCLVGDSSDNIPGIKGVGPKKAAGILHGVPMQRRWNRVKAAYRMHNTTGADLSRTLLTMLRSFEEYETVRDKIENKTHQRQQDVWGAGQTHVQDERILSVSERGEGPPDRD